jgi:phosphatidylglycerol:prolipoprotein diacylglycerol transferase
VHPVFIKLGNFTIATYGVLVAIGFALGLWLAARRAKADGIAAEQIHNLGVWLIIAGMGGGKLFYIIFHWADFRAGWHAEGIRSLREGFVFYGGFIGAALAGWLYTRAKNLPFLKLADAFAPALALGHAFGRLGCFANGCCYGKACDLPWGVRFPAGHLARNFPVHPTQLYEVAGNLAIFTGLMWYTKRKRFDGQVWWFYILAYGAMRFMVEFFRGDYDSRYLNLFTLGHVIAAALILIALIGHEWSCRRSRRL